jgi:hypothetical protein
MKKVKAKLAPEVVHEDPVEATYHSLNLRGVHGAILAERSDSKNRDIAESG